MLKSLIVVDVQEKLLPAVSGYDQLLGQLSKCIRAHTLLELPIIITEQYPKGLGSTLSVLSEHAKDAEILSKTSFSCFGGGIEELLENSGSKELLLVGIEAHVCVYQTCMDALAKGYGVTVLVDCVSSRSNLDRDVALANMQRSGARLSTFECEYMALIKDAKHPSFKSFSVILKD
jgi:hypothetical protein